MGVRGASRAVPVAGGLAQCGGSAFLPLAPSLSTSSVFPGDPCRRSISFRSLMASCGVFERFACERIDESVTTSNGGSLGSCIDEERSKLRYLVRIAEFSESSSLRTQMAPPGSFPRARLSERSVLQAQVSPPRGPVRRGRSFVGKTDVVRSSSARLASSNIPAGLRVDHGPAPVRRSRRRRRLLALPLCRASDQARKPAEFKHINKRRRGN